MRVKIWGEGRVGKEGATLGPHIKLTRGHQLQFSTDGDVLHATAVKRLIRIPGTNITIGPVARFVDRGSKIRPELFDAGTPVPDRFEVQAVRKRFGIVMGEVGGTMSSETIEGYKREGFRVQVKVQALRRW